MAEYRLPDALMREINFAAVRNAKRAVQLYEQAHPMLRRNLSRDRLAQPPNKLRSAPA